MRRIPNQHNIALDIMFSVTLPQGEYMAGVTPLDPAKRTLHRVTQLRVERLIRTRHQLIRPRIIGGPDDRTVTSCGISADSARARTPAAPLLEALQGRAIVHFAGANRRDDGLLPIIPFACFKTREVSKARITAIGGDDQAS